MIGTTFSYDPLGFWSLLGAGGMAPGSGKSTTHDRGRPPQGIGLEKGTPALFRVGGVVCFGPDRHGVWRYLPDFADVVRDAVGCPMVTFVDIHDAGFLMLTATWAASAEDLAALQGAAATRSGEPDPTRVRIGFVPLTAVACRLVVDGITVESSGTSGMPPYDSLFNVPLRGDLLVAVRAVLNEGTGGPVHGERHSIRVEYNALLALPQRGTATLTTLGSRLRTWLAGRPLDRTTLEQAVQIGIASIRFDFSAGEPGALLDDLYQRLLDEVTKALAGNNRGIGDDVFVSATLEWSLPHPVAAGADVAPAPSQDRP